MIFLFYGPLEGSLGTWAGRYLHDLGFADSRVYRVRVGFWLAFLASRYLLRDWVERKFGHRLGPIQEGFRRNAFSYLLTLRLIPAFPFFLVNLVSGLTRINIGTYVLATAVGIIPGSFVFANAGRQLGSINSLAEIASPAVLGAFALLGLFALVPVLYRRFVRRAGHP